VTYQRPVDLFAQERQHLKPLNQNRYDVARTATARASNQFRITLVTNHYSVPSAHAHRRLTIKAYPDRICIYFDIARHARSCCRHQDIEEIARRTRASEQRLMLRFLALSPDAQTYYSGLCEAWRWMRNYSPVQLARAGVARAAIEKAKPR